MNKMILIGGGAVLLLAAAGGGAAFFMMGGGDPQALNGEPLEPELAAAKDVFYYNIHPEFVVNFRGNSRAKFMMIEMSVATHDEEVTAVIDDHMPELRNDLLMVLAEQEADDLKTLEGKTALREKAKETISTLVEKFHGPDKIEDVFLTRLVMQ